MDASPPPGVNQNVRWGVRSEVGAKYDQKLIRPEDALKELGHQIWAVCLQVRGNYLMIHWPAGILRNMTKCQSSRSISILGCIGPPYLNSLPLAVSLQMCGNYLTKQRSGNSENSAELYERSGEYHIECIPQVWDQSPERIFRKWMKPHNWDERPNGRTD